MTLLRIFPISGAALTTLVVGLSMPSVEAAAHAGNAVPIGRSGAAMPSRWHLSSGGGIPGIMAVADMPSMQSTQPTPSPSSSPSAGGMMDDDKMGMPMQQPAPPAAHPPAADAGMQNGGMMMGGKMGRGMAQMPAGDAMQMPMMPMMQAMMRGQASDPLDRFEGRIAFLKAEIGISDAQAPAWDQFAQALRTDRQHLLDARQALSISMSQSDTLSRLAAYEHHLSMRLDALRSAQDAFTRLYGMLSDAQKRTADELALPFLETF